MHSAPSLIYNFISFFFSFSPLPSPFFPYKFLFPFLFLKKKKKTLSFFLFPPKRLISPRCPAAPRCSRCGSAAAPARLRCPGSKPGRDEGTGPFSFQFHGGNGRILTGTTRGEIGTYRLPEGCANQHAGLDIKVQGK